MELDDAKTSKVERRELKVVVVLVALILIIFYPVVAKMAAVEHDYIAHINRAASLMANFVFSPHLLYQISTIILYLLLPIGIFTSGIFVVLICYAALGVILYFFLKNDKIPQSIAFGGALSLLFVAQIPGFYPLDQHLYFGYIGINVLHNPTMVVLKPLAMLLFMQSARIVTVSYSSRKSLLVAGCAILSILTAFAKPNYTICFVPVLVLVLSYRTYRRLSIDWILAAVGFLLPSISFLLFQYALSYADFIPHLPRFYEQSSIIFSPLQVVKIYSSWLLPKFVLSVLFPLAVVACYARESMEDFLLKFSWFAFGFGSFYMYFLAETGASRMAQGNFWWSGQITLFILFACSVRMFLRMAFSGAKDGSKTPFRWKNWVLGGILALHIASGLIYYYAEYSQPQRFW